MKFGEREVAEFELRPGDLLVCEGGEPGRAAVWRDRGSEIKFQKAIHRIRLRGGIRPDLLMYHLKHDALRGGLEEYFTGSTIKHLTGVSLARYLFNLPPLAEQQRIVAKVEALLSRVNSARQRLAKAPAILKRFRQSVLAAACSGRLTADWREVDSPEWERVELGTVINRLHQGWSPKCEIEPSPSNDVWGVIKTTAVQHLQFLPEENKRLPNNLEPETQLELHAGDLLITRAGPRVRAGVACLVRKVRPRLIVCDKVYRFQALEDKCQPDYVEIALNTPEALETIDTLKTGTSDSGVNLTQEKFKALEIALPPLAEQHEIVRRVEALFKLADAIANRVAAATARADKLTQAILAKAFRGELVPTEAELARREVRDYEPASMLLERTKKEREHAEAEMKPRRKRAKAKN